MSYKTDNFKYSYILINLKMAEKDFRLTEDDIKMIDEEPKESLFTGFGEDKDEKKANYKVLVAVFDMV